jgi:hypothetical protein
MPIDQDLMTQELLNGYTQRTIGEPVRRVMRSVLASSTGLGVGSCTVTAGVSSNSRSEDASSSVTLPLWAAIAIGTIGTVGIGVFLAAMALSVARRRRAAPGSSTSSSSSPSPSLFFPIDASPNTSVSSPSHERSPEFMENDVVIVAENASTASEVIQIRPFDDEIKTL